MSRYRLSRQARSDLDDIWLYIAPDSLTAADRLIDALLAKFQVLATQPGMGRMRDELAASVRSFPVGSYVIFYRATQDGIDVVRVLSRYRDIPSVFAGE